MKLFSLVVLVLYWVFFSTYAEELQKNQSPPQKANDWKVPEVEANRVNPVKYTPDSILRGKQQFLRTCANCHGVEAKGDGPAARYLKTKLIDLTIPENLNSDADLAWKIKNGKGDMPAWKKLLGKNQIWDLVNYIQSLKVARSI